MRTSPILIIIALALLVLFPPLGGVLILVLLWRYWRGRSTGMGGPGVSGRVDYVRTIASPAMSHAGPVPRHQPLGRLESRVLEHVRSSHSANVTISASSLARELGVDTSMVRTAIDNLARQGLIQR